MKKVVFILLLFISFSCIHRNVYAADKTVEVNLDKDYKNCVFQITWENIDQNADAVVISPKGKKFGLKSTPDQVTTSQGSILINVGAAKIGIWNVVITGEKLGRVVVTGGEIPGNIEIKNFEVTKQNEGYLAKWNVTDCKDNLTVQIYADSDKTGYDGKLITSLSSSPSGETTYKLDGLQNGNYYFYIKVSDDSGIFNYAYASTPIQYEDINSPAKLNKVSAVMLNSDIYLSWDASEHNVFKILLFDADTKEILQEDTTEEGSYITSMPSGKDRVLAAVASFDYDELGQYDMYEVSTTNTPKAKVTYPKESITNQKTILVNVSFQGDYTITATLNDKVMMKDNTETGKYRIDMEDGNNSIVFLIKDNKGNMASYLKELYVDSTAPQLAVKEDINKVTTNQSYIYVQGYSEAGATLYCNKKKAKMVNNYFNIKCNLKFGKNKILISAKDVAGNEARYTATVIRNFWNNSMIQISIIVAVAAILIIIYTIIFIKGIKKRKTYEKN